MPSCSNCRRRDTGDGVTEAPLETYRFTLTAADALAWETRPRQFGLWGKLGYVAPLLLGGIGIGLLPLEWTAGWRLIAIGLGLVAVVYLGWTVVINLLADRRARRRYPVPTEMVVEDWVDHLAVTENGREDFIAPETIGALIRAKEHLLITSGRHLLIMPRRAFEGGSYEPFAAQLVLRGRQPSSLSGGPVPPRSASPLPP